MKALTHILYTNYMVGKFIRQFEDDIFYAQGNVTFTHIHYHLNLLSMSVVHHFCEIWKWKSGIEIIINLLFMAPWTWCHWSKLLSLLKIVVTQFNTANGLNILFLDPRMWAHVSKLLNHLNLPICIWTIKQLFLNDFKSVPTLSTPTLNGLFRH
jgi:hypothetical protein